MKHSARCLLFVVLSVVLLAGILPAHADEQMNAIRKRGSLKVAVYNNFLPYSDAGKGIDVELAQALAARLGLKPDIIGFQAGEDMNDDLRNMVWKGHYLRGEPADVMLRVPVDPIFVEANDKARIFAPYHQEVMCMARVASRIPPPNGSAAIALEVFTREKIGVESDTLADSFLGGVLHGRLLSNIVHLRSVGEAAKALQTGGISAILATCGELEAALAGDSRFAIDEAKLGELNPKRWQIGMAVKAESGELARVLSTALAELQQDGTVAAIFKRHNVSLRTR
jgi:ABC-type amino acid transport substrate-binding protein